MLASLRYSFLAAFLIISFKLVIYSAHLQLTPAGIFLSIFSLVSMAVPLFMTMKNRRDNEQGGFLTLRQAMRSGLEISVISGTLVGIFAYIQFRFIDHDTLSMIIERVTEEMRQGHAAQSQIDSEIILKKDFYSPFNQAKGALVGVLGAGFIISFICATFLMKNAPVSEN